MDKTLLTKEESKESSTNTEINANRLSLKTFLEETPPDNIVSISDFTPLGDGQFIQTPELLLHCGNDACQGPRIFNCKDSLYLSKNWSTKFLTYSCRNCDQRLYRFAIMWCVSSTPIGSALKVGQVPPFGPSTPAGLIRLIEADRELFLQGRRAENRGMGIGAFAYYRRVVENQRNQIIAKIAKVAKALGSTPQIDQVFTAAINETQFAKSIETIEPFLPQALLINGENPLKLLHSALSRGLHNPDMTDAHCLQLAQSIRIVLTELAERSATALKEDQELQQALNTLKAVPHGPKLSPEIIDIGEE